MTVASELVARGRSKPPALKTRKLTGCPTWPIVLLAGVEGSGKSYSAIEASLSPLIGFTYGIEIGETSLDPYGALVDDELFDLIEHDYTYADIAEQLWAVVEAPRVHPDKPNLIVFDGGSGLWDLLVNEAQIIANARAKKHNKRLGEDGQADVTPDLWNAAKKRWMAVIDLLKSHDGPVIITGRLLEVAVFEGSTPKRDGSKEWKVEAHKSLPFDVDVVMQARAVRDWSATKARSLKFQIEPGQTRAVPEFSVDKLIRLMGIDENTKTNRRAFVAQNAGAGAEQQQADARGDIPVSEWLALIARTEVVSELHALHARANAAKQLNVVIDGQTIDARLRSRAEVLEKAGAEDTAAVRAAADKARAASAPRSGAEKVATKRMEVPGTAPAEEPAPELSEAEKAAAEEAEQEKAVAEAEQRDMLKDELVMLARLARVQPVDLTHRVLPAGPNVAPLAEVQKATAGLRVVGIAKLKAAGRTAEAAAYGKVGADSYGPPAHLLGTDDLSWLPDPVAPKAA